ncbi:hypothetical protein JWV26_22575 [Ectopseudomonas toyotomiensis]|uniref:PIN-like domain-containing protein n=1 Tax=Ectopseudomonas toyotomiensis TaxID=554344 RepID=A0ABD7DVE8_9GAMM|nr:PIN domain-containing protein [Pseudomonas toyotomiensis]QSL92494.1 hypothetical protein JWV26_22575 [Pseudomonas toyotomiensis]
MRVNYVFIDYENVQVTSLRLLQPDHFKLRVFLGPNNTKLPTELVTAIHQLHDRAEYIQMDTPGANALDFHITYYLGVLSAEDPAGYYHIISKDKGFDPLIKHLKSRGVTVVRSESIEQMPCFKQIAPTPTQTVSAPAKSPEKKTVTVRKDDVISLVVADLVARKSSRPRTIKTLKSTIHAKVGKDHALGEIEVIYRTLRQRGYVKEAGEKVSYALPALN